MNLQTFRMIKKNELLVREYHSNKTPKCHVTSQRERERDRDAKKCEQIWRNFATYVINKISLAIA